MTKADLIDAVAKKTGLTKKDAGAAIDESMDAIKKSLKKEGRFSYPDFGTFTVVERKARMGINPQTKEKMKIKKSKSVKFKPSPKLKKMV